MLNFTYEDGKLVAVSTELGRRPETINRNDFGCLDTARTVAAEATALTGRIHLGIDKGDYTSPRYDVIEAPAVGQEVSYAFNGDYYPAGKIVRVSAGPRYRRVQTDRGVVFWRTGDTSGRWAKAGGTWTMVAGTHSRLNPEF